MKKLITLLFICSIASAQAQFKESRKISAHHSISVATGITVEYVNSNRNEVVVEVEKKEYLNLLQTDVKLGTLEIRYKPNSKIRTQKASTVTVYSNASLEKAKVSSSGSLTVKAPVNKNTFKIDVSSSGKFAGSSLTADEIEIDISSSGKVDASVNTKSLEIDATSSSKTTISGNANDVSVEMSSSAAIDLTRLKINALEIDGSSSSKLTFNTSNTLDSELSSSAKATYNKAPATIIKNKTSSSGKLSQN